MFDEDIWTKTDGKEFVGIMHLIRKERIWDEKLVIDVILIALEQQTVGPIVTCKNINHMVRPHWDEIGEAVFLDMKWKAIEYPPFNDSDAGE